MKKYRMNTDVANVIDTLASQPTKFRLKHNPKCTLKQKRIIAKYLMLSNSN